MSRSIVLVPLVAAALAPGCASSPPRFRDQPVVWRVDDARSIPEPEENEYLPTEYYTNLFVRRRFERALEIQTDRPAGNTNALDEVPDSTWFQNRIGARPVSPEEAAIGPTAGDHGPPVLPLRVVHAKVGGGNPGFIAADATGRRYLVKFDTHENPEMQTAGNVVVNRIFWTLGYNVPADHVVVFRRDELAAPKELAAAVDAALATSPVTADGAYRATASELLPGIPKGGWSLEGVREDDPNDRVPHQHRRELRALRVFAAWVSHTGLRQDNTLSMYVEEDGRRFLRHYLVDFGEALDGHAASHRRREDGYENYWDWEHQPRALFSFGLWKRPWEDIEPTRWPAIGSFSSKWFDARRWREAYPYFPFQHMNAADAFWGAKLVMRFDRPMIAAIVAAGRYSDREAAAYLVDTLMERRDKVGRAWLDGVTPLDELRVAGGELCMVDLAVRHGFAGTSTIVRTEGERRDTFAVGEGGRVCLPLPPPERYTVWKLRAHRSGADRPEMQVHLRGGKVIGVIR